MFNAPRPAQRYTATNGLGGLGASYVDDNPLAASVYDDGLDPWSAAPSPGPTPAPQPPQQQGQTNSVFSSVIGKCLDWLSARSHERWLIFAALADATVPSVYHRSFAAVDPDNTGEVSVSALSRVLMTSGLPAATIDRVSDFMACVVP